MALQTFTAGQVLTAAQVTALQTNDFNQTVSTKTANYTFVVGDRGTRVVGNGTSITFTVDNSIFSAGDTIKLHNINSTVLTIAAGAGVTINNAAGLTMVQWQEATLFATSASSFILFESTAAAAQGLTLINTSTFSGVSSVSLPTNTFTSSYDAYRLVFTNLSCTANALFRLRFRKAGTDNTSANYYGACGVITWTNVLAAGGGSAAATSSFLFTLSTVYNTTSIDITQPLVRPQVTGLAMSAGPEDRGSWFSAFINASDTFDSATFFPASGNITGSVSVYGYNK
jgi:hypothetical protein